MAQLEEGEKTYFIADSALYSKQNVQALSQVGWITRVPGTLKAVQDLYRAIEPKHMRPATQEGYQLTELCSTYGDLGQRWVVVFSEAAYERERGKLQERVAEEREEADKTLQQLRGHEFATVEEAEETAGELTEAWSYHHLQLQLEPVPHYSHRGRPRKGERPERVGWRVAGGEVGRDERAIQQTKGKFILATNELDEEKLSA